MSDDVGGEKIGKAWVGAIQVQIDGAALKEFVDYRFGPMGSEERKAWIKYLKQMTPMKQGPSMSRSEAGKVAARARWGPRRIVNLTKIDPEIAEHIRSLLGWS